MHQGGLSKCTPRGSHPHADNTTEVERFRGLPVWGQRCASRGIERRGVARKHRHHLLALFSRPRLRNLKHENMKHDGAPRGASRRPPPLRTAPPAEPQGALAPRRAGGAGAVLDVRQDAGLHLVVVVHLRRGGLGSSAARQLLVQAENLRVQTSGSSPMDPGIPPLEIKILLESNPLKSRFLVRELSVARVPPSSWPVHETLSGAGLRKTAYGGPQTISYGGSAGEGGIFGPHSSFSSSGECRA